MKAASILGAGIAMLCLCDATWAEQPAARTPSKAPATATPRLADGHVDFSGNWSGMTGSFPQDFAVQRLQDGSILANSGARRTAPAGGGGVTMPAAPTYKPELVAKTQALFKNGATEDKVVACGQPGLPRVGAPQKIVQTASEMVFLYADGSGMAWRVIPLDGRKHRDRVDPSYYGDSVGHWDGDALVVDTRNFSEDTWMGEYGNFHSDQMRVVERITRQGDKLTWQATVTDPVVLETPWVKAPVVMTWTAQQIEEPAVCVPTNYQDPAGHHIQRF